MKEGPRRSVDATDCRMFTRCSSSSSPTGVRSRCGSSGPPASWASRRSASTPRRTRDGPWLEHADRTICIGPGPATESYLRIDRIISAAEIANVDAIHPGYGFLAENAHFAEVCRDCHIEFIGPAPRRWACSATRSAAGAWPRRRRRRSSPAARRRSRTPTTPSRSPTRSATRSSSRRRPAAGAAACGSPTTR